MPKTQFKISNPKVKITRLEKEDNAFGLCWPDGLIEIEVRQNDKAFFSTLIHELIHHFFPDISEKNVLKIEKIMARKLWNHFCKKFLKKYKQKQRKYK